MRSADNEPWFARLLQSVTRHAVRRPLIVVSLGVLLALASLLMAGVRLTFKTNRLDLLNPQSAFNQRWLSYLDEFGDHDDAVVVIAGPPEQVEVGLNAVVARLGEAALGPEVVLGSPDFARLAAAGLHLMPLEDLQRLEQRLSHLPRSAQQWSQLNVLSLLTRANQQLAAESNEETIQFGAEIVRSILAALRTPATYYDVWQSVAPSNVIQQHLPDYLQADEGRMGFVLVSVPRNNGVPSTERIEFLRRVINNIRAELPAVEIGMTGVPILEYDEMRSSQEDMGKSAALSLAGVALLFAAGFGGLRLPLMAVVNLVIALCWCLAYITLAIGHLNILSVAFGAILIGLGIDFGIHLVAAYAELRGDTDDSASALVMAVGHVGPGIVTGGVTSAIAFCTAVLTDFTGVAELGLIAGGGMVLCMLSSLFVLPALIELVERRRDAGPLPRPLPAGILAAVPSSAPRVTLALMAAVTIALAVGLPRLRYDHNLLNLQPRQSESVRWERLIVERSGQSQWYALSVCDDLETLRRRRAALLQQPTVERTESIEPLLGAASPARNALIQRLRRWTTQLPKSPQTMRVNGVVEGLAKQLLETERLSQSGNAELSALAAETRGQLLSGANNVIAKMHALSVRQANELLKRLQQLATATASPPPQINDLPPELLARYVGRSRKLLLKVYASGEARDMEGLKAFVEEVEEVDPLCTGHPVQTYYASKQMQRSFLHAAIYSLLAVAAVLMLDFRSIRQTLLAMLPMALGLAQLLGLLSWLGIPLNPANMIVLPLIMGIGIDDGVHVVHDFRRQPGKYRLGNTTATAVLVTSATTMVGFGSMMVSRHQGLHSLGQVLTLGVFWCLVNSVIVLPAMLVLVRGQGDERSQ